MMSIKDLSKVRKKIIIAAASVVGGLLLIYLCMVAYFNCHIFPGTRFGNVKLSGKSADGAEEELDGLLADYKLAMQDGTISSEDQPKYLDIVINECKRMTGILTQQSIKDLLIKAGDENEIDSQLERFVPMNCLVSHLPCDTS